MPIIDHNQAPEVPWRPGYRKWDVAGREQGVTSTFSIDTGERAADLAVMLAVASSLRNEVLDPGLVALGEVGLSGELRSVPQVQRRLAEAARLGLSRCVLPQTALEGLSKPEGMELIPARTLRQAFRAVLSNARGQRADPLRDPLDDESFASLETG